MCVVNWFNILNNSFWFGLSLYVPVNNFSVMSGQSHRFLGITSIYYFIFIYFFYFFFIFLFFFIFFFFFGGGGGAKRILLKDTTRQPE